MFAIACAGSVVTHEGDVQLEPGQAKSIVATITDADLLVAGKVSWNQGILSESSPEWVNTVVANYIEPTQQWASHQAPPARTVADVIADGRPREAQVALRLVKDLNQAQRVAEILRRLGRLWGRAGVMLGPRFCELEEGDWINWQSDRYFAGATKTFRIEAYTIDEKWQNSLTLREINASVFDGVFAFDSDHSVTTPTTPPPAIGSPGGSQWALVAVTLSNGGASVPALEITGSASDDIAVQEIVVEYWKSDGVINPVTNPDDPTWVMEGSHPPTTTKVDITSIQGGQVYYAAVSYVVSGITGDRRVLGPVTAASIDVSDQVSPLIDAAVGKLAWKQPVRAKTTAALAANTYANGTAGVGATLTATANGALAAQDGVTLVVNDRLIVDHEATGSHNGIYKVTQLGDGSHPYILTRASDADEAAELVNAAAKISEGATFADQEWQCTNNVTVTVGTTALIWAQVGGSAAITIKDEGTTLTSAPTSVNFTGSGVTATVSGSDVTVNVPGATITTFDKARTYLNTATTTGTGGWQKVPVDTVDYDTGSMWDATNKRFKPTRAGYYQCNARVRVNVLGINAVGIGKNGSILYAVGTDTGSTIIGTGGSDMVFCNGTSDYLELFCFTTLGRALTTGITDTAMSVVGPL
jgi:hypothetical protein